MKFLLFLLWVSFFFIFFLFSRYWEIKWSFFENLFWQWNLYVFCVLFIIMLISWRDSSEKSQAAGISVSSFNTILKNMLRDFFNKYIYYVALAFFYVWFFLLCRAIFWDIEISFIFLFCNLSVLFLSSFEEKLPFVSSLIRVNTSFISLYYIIVHSAFLFWVWNTPNLIDIVNIITLTALWYRFLYVSDNISHKNIFYIYVYFFLFIEMCVIWNIFFSQSVFLYGVLSFFIGSGLLLFTDLLNKHILFPKNISRWVWVIYLSVTVFLLYFQIGSVDFITLIYCFTVILSSYILYAFHARFRNYLALFFSLSWYIGVFMILYLFLLDFEIWGELLLTLMLVISYALLFAQKILPKTDIHDGYFFQLYSFFVNLISSFWFFFFIDFSILQVGLFFLAESVYLLLIYYNIKVLRNA